MIKVIERKTSIQIHCTRADWPLVKWCMDEGLSQFYLMAFMETERDNPDTNPAGAEEFKAWKRNGKPCVTSALTQIDKS